MKRTIDNIASFMRDSPNIAPIDPYGIVRFLPIIKSDSVWPHQKLCLTLL